MQLQLALLLSQISMPTFRRVCRTFVFLGRFFLVSLFVCLFVCLLVHLLVCLGRESIWSAANVGSLPWIARSINSTKNSDNDKDNAYDNSQSHDNGNRNGNSNDNNEELDIEKVFF